MPAISAHLDDPHVILTENCMWRLEGCSVIWKLSFALGIDKQPWIIG